MTTFKESLLILLFEFLGTLLLTSLYNSCFQSGDGAGLLCGFFVLLIFSARISGSHFNPAITLAFMFRRDTGRFSRLLGLLYIAAQYAGALLGAIISYNLFQANAKTPLTVGYNDDGTVLLVQAMVMEMIGAMLITFLYLTQTEKDTKMSEDPAITTLIIAATYVAVVSYSEVFGFSYTLPGGEVITGGVMTGSPFNPAASLGLFFAILFQGNIKTTEHTWVFLFFSYAGSMLAVLLFECVYKKAMAVSTSEANVDDISDEDGPQ